MSKIKIIVAIIASVAVLAGAGAGVYFGFFADNDSSSSQEDKKDKDSKEDNESESAGEEDTSADKNETPSKENLVTDAKIELLPYGSIFFCYHIPQINYPSDEISDFNEKISEYYEKLADEQIDYEKENGYMSIGDISYIYGVKDNIVSVVMRESYAEYYGVTYKVYNIDLKTGKELSDSEVLELMGVDEDGFRESVRSAIQLYIDNTTADGEDYYHDEYSDKAIADSLSDESISKARPYVNIDGKLCAVTQMLLLGGVNSFDQPICLENGEVYTVPLCEETHFDELYKDMSEKEKEAAILYTEYLTKKGHSEITSCESSVYYYYDITSCFKNFFGDGTPELFIMYEKKEYNFDGAGAFYADALLTIKDGKVVVVEKSENWGGSGGGSQMDIVYDKANACPAVVYCDSQRAGYAYNQQVYRAYSADYIAGNEVDSYYSSYIYIEDFTKDDIDKIKDETDKWVENTDESSFRYYKCNEDYITEDEFNEFLSNFEFGKVISGYELKTVTELKPI